ncbi:isochorismatase family cysteine hydrolase [Bacillus sp. 31A1R]|uniref:Isochorismatase family cysteine hydrolase n=1 Tax=Robertmurraya mangrovi TaxID=3098077 RepID=A0ABU5IZ13_9BACI|nr:isochorismatase family cysteine hydrolase [Bacillus sp. 31A1R]MDZ5472408.1 isochorismatase family cysteine hydrolase [Bacillus sp. 31A1R]
MLMISVIGILGLCIGIIALRLFYLSSATKGESIAKYYRPKSALLVLDIQNDTLGIPLYGNTEPLMANINKAIEYANDTNMEIIYTKQEFTGHPLDSLLTGGMYQANSEGADLYDELSIQSDNIFSKLRTDAFSVELFENYLIKNEISTLYIVGADASACVYKTALGGINRGYRVIILEDSIFSVKRDKLNTMLNKYQSKGIEISNMKNFIQTQTINF